MGENGSLQRRRGGSGVDNHSLPLLRELKPHTDLSIAPPNWLIGKDDASVNPFVTRRLTEKSIPDWVKLWKSSALETDRNDETNATAALIDSVYVVYYGGMRDCPCRL